MGWREKWEMHICPKRSVPERIQQRWGNEDFQEWGNLWYWHCAGAAWSGGRRITHNYVNCPVGSENTGASLEGREVVTWVTRWPCLKPCQAVGSLKAELRVSTARAGCFFFPPPVHTLTWSACGVTGNPKKIQAADSVSEVESRAWTVSTHWNCIVHSSATLEFLHTFCLLSLRE